MELFHFKKRRRHGVLASRRLTIYRVLEDYMRRKLTAAGYRENQEPQCGPQAREASGPPGTSTVRTVTSREIDEEHAKEKRVNSPKPMNCPANGQIFKRRH